MHVRAALLLSLVACSNGAKREDGSVKPDPPPQVPAAKVQKVYLETPRGELAVTVEVVDTWPKIEKGLMYREFLAPDAGMLFKMGDDADHAFFMKNTLIPLDMMFIKRDMTVAGIVENAEPRTLTLRRVGIPSRYVLEVNGGYARAHGVTAGAKVRFENITH